MPEFYEIAEEHDAKYDIRLKANATLYKYAEELTERIEKIYKNNLYNHYVIYGEFMYKAKTWNKERRVVVKLEEKEDQMYIDYTFVVTNMISFPEGIIIASKLVKSSRYLKFKLCSSYAYQNEF